MNTPRTERTERQHEPKLRALHALHEQQLSAAAQARLMRHLASCGVCTQALRGLRLHSQLVPLVVQNTPQLDFSRMELALRREAKAQANQRKAKTVAVPAMLTLALAAALLLMLRPMRHVHRTAETQPSTLASRTPTPQPEAAVLHAVVTALRGSVSVAQRGSAEHALTLEQLVDEGQVLHAAPDSEAHLRLTRDTALALGAASQLELQRLREGQIELGLREGRVTSQVRHLQDGERYEVHALGYTVAVRGTRFMVAVADGQLRVEVEEGHVVVTDAQGKLVGDVLAPGSFDTRSDARAGIERALAHPRIAGDPSSRWPALTLPQWRDASAWQIDGNNFPASAQLAMRVPSGELTLVAQLGDGQLRKTVVHVPEEGLRVEEDVLRRLTRPNLELHDAPELKPEVIMGVVQTGLPVLQRCYELSLKLRPDVSGRLTLRITLDPSGRVTRVIPVADAHANAGANSTPSGVPDDLVSCIRAGAARWHFPPPGGSGLSFDAPIRLTRHN